MIPECDVCGVRLTDEEVHYYERLCEKCERAWSDRMDDWRHGRIQEPELDAFYGQPR